MLVKNKKMPVSAYCPALYRVKVTPTPLPTTLYATRGGVGWPPPLILMVVDSVMTMTMTLNLQLEYGRNVTGMDNIFYSVCFY